uniref:S100/CaBP-9k-type calcium binding subdomain domain-containing protein n=1 Tax=Stegastes partitus TaxID=144197 RepID=A0A3B5AKR4_9TELE
MELTNLETAVAYMFSVFMSKQGDNGKMDKWDFKEVLNKELPSFTKVRRAVSNCRYACVHTHIHKQVLVTVYNYTTACSKYIFDGLYSSQK